MPTHETPQDAALARLGPLVGEWSVEAVFPGAAPTDQRGRAVFEWTLGGQFLAQRSDIPHPDAPDALAIIGVDPAGSAYLQHYFDSRGVTRVYAMSFDGAEWKLVRDTPDFSPLNFWQRFTGTISGDGNTIDGSWEMCRDGSTWEHDFRLTYTRV